MIALKRCDGSLCVCCLGQVGSGLGYWAMLLRAQGVDVNAYDKVGGAPDAGDSPSPAPKRAKKKGAKAKLPDPAVASKKEEATDAGGGEDAAPSFWTKVGNGGWLCAAGVCRGVMLEIALVEEVERNRGGARSVETNPLVVCRCQPSGRVGNHAYSSSGAPARFCECFGKV